MQLPTEDFSCEELGGVKVNACQAAPAPPPLPWELLGGDDILCGEEREDLIKHCLREGAQSIGSGIICYRHCANGKDRSIADQLYRERMPCSWRESTWILLTFFVGFDFGNQFLHISFLFHTFFQASISPISGPPLKSDSTTNIANHRSHFMSH